MEVEDTPRRGPGRPRKGTVTTVTKQEILDEDEIDDEPVDESFNAIFDPKETKEKAVVKIRVTRKDPDEGMLGYFDDPSVSEAAVKDLYGGGTFRIDGVNSHGAMRQSRVIKIAGDPIFQSQAAEIQWRRAKGLPPKPIEQSGAQQTQGMSFQEYMTFTREADDRRRQEERDHQISLRKLELDAEDRKRKDEEERIVRLRKDEEERDRRRAKDDDDREARRRRDQEEAEKRQQQFMQQTIQMINASSQQAIQLATAGKDDSKGGLFEALKVIAAVKETFGDGDKTDGEESTLNLLIKHGEKILGGAGNAIGNAIREVKQGGTQGTGPAAAPQLSPVVPVGAGTPLAAKLETLVAKIAARGQDPEKVLSGVADGLIATLDGQPVAPSGSVIPATEKVAYVSRAIRVPFVAKKD